MAIYNITIMTSGIGTKFISDTQMRFEAPNSITWHKPRAIELFAGVGGFRLGLQESFDIVWSNQWEPSTKRQDASDIYVNHFQEEGHTCQDIDEVLRRIEEEEIPIPQHDLLVGGFPCQDYSVARVLNQATGLVGKKGVLWWSIYDLLKKFRPRFILLENVDRLLKSPANQRGRDFAIMLKSLAELGYRVQWRVVNAADYGFPQRRRRVFIVGEQADHPMNDPTKHVLEEGILARALPVTMPINNCPRTAGVDVFSLDMPLEDISDAFGIDQKVSQFRNAGVMEGSEVHTLNVSPAFDGPWKTLGDILQPQNEVDPSFFIPDFQLKTWKYLKGAKSEPRIHRGSGTEYRYAEGAIAFPDPLDRPSRTILTGEGGSSPSRFKHVIEAPDGRLRRLTPIEMERLNGFEDDWTKSATNSRRAFLMGNALVVGVVAKIGAVLKQECSNLLPSNAASYSQESAISTHSD